MNYENIKRSNECWIMFIVLMLCHNNGPRIRSYSSAHKLATSWYVQLNFKSYGNLIYLDFDVRWGWCGVHFELYRNLNVFIFKKIKTINQEPKKMWKKWYNSMENYKLGFEPKPWLI